MPINKIIAVMSPTVELIAISSTTVFKITVKN